MKQAILVLAGLSLLAGISSASEGIGNVDIHGFISQGYLQTDHNNYMAQTKGKGSFEFNELGLNFGTDLSDKLRLGMQFFARDLGTDGNDELVLDWAFADYRWRDWLGFRVGRIKNSYGYYNAIRDFDMLRTSVLVPQSVYPEMIRDTFSFMKGISLYGNATLGEFGNLSYNALAGLPNVSKETGLIGAQEDFWSFYNLKVQEASIEQSYDVDIQWETPITGLMVGGTYYKMNDIHIEGTLGGDGGYGDILGLTFFKEYMDLKGYFLTLRYTIGNAVFMTEFTQNAIKAMFDADLDPAIHPFVDADPGYLKAEALTSQGWYASFAYRFAPFFEAEYTCSVYYPDKTNKNGKDRYGDDPLHIVLGAYNPNVNQGILKQFYGNDFEAWKKTHTLSLRFDINEFWLIKLESSYNDGFGDYTSADNGDHKSMRRYWWLNAAKVTYNF